MNKTLEPDFKYSHKNIYHDKLEDFADFVYRDDEAEIFRGNWNKEIFKREAPLCAEVGTGYGHFMMEYCENNPDINFVGMDYRFKRSFALAKKLSLHPTKNFRYLRAKGERLNYLFGDNEVDRLFYFFPDPWPKARHHKKRLFQLPFLKAAYQVLKPGATLFVKTDHDGYADWMEEVMNSPEVKEMFDVTLSTRDLRVEHPEHFLSSFKTKFEKIFVAKGIPIKAYTLVSKKK
jgi:tRNA (guanine-N7-)-methyltransferase